MDKTSSGGLGIGGALLILFVGLKLAGVIAWSWWWVVSPLWLPFACILLAVIVYLLIIAVAALVGGFVRWFKRKA